MNSMQKLTSSHRLILTNILSISALVLITMLASIFYISDKREKAQLEKNTTAWANSLAQVSIPFLQQNEQGSDEALQTLLNQLITSTDINYIHIYKTLENGQINYFSGFNKNAYFPSIPDKIDNIEQLSNVKHQQNYIELIIRIKKNQELYGYLYIQSSNKALNNYLTKLSFVVMAFFIFGLILFTILAFVINRKINEPIKILKNSIQAISHSKDFSQRVQTLPLTELDILAKNINFLLGRVENHISKENKKHQQVIEKNNNLTNKVNTRTDALKESNQELLSTLEKLHQYQDQLVEIEKIASLGDMVAGIAHEINTPIGLGVTASTLLDDRLKEIINAFENKTLKSSQLKKFLTEGEENIGIIYRNLDRAAKLISSFKEVAVDQSNEEVRQFNINNLLEQVLLTLKAKIKKENVKLTLECPNDLIIKSKPGPINQILINLIINSIMHGFEHKQIGMIHISVSYLSEQLHINYQDDGTGIDDSIKSRVFDPFTTTKRGHGGSGLGLHLVFNLVTQALNGHIDCESDAEHGTSFNITFPVTLAADYLI